MIQETISKMRSGKRKKEFFENFKTNLKNHVVESSKSEATSNKKFKKKFDKKYVQCFNYQSMTIMQMSDIQTIMTNVIRG